jgi:two-component system, OmpR family, response regulator ArlR
MLFPEGLMRNCVLIVENDKSVSRFLQTKLEADGFTVMQDTTGESAVDMAGQRQVDIIVLDPDPPMKNAMELVQNVRAISTVPILFISEETSVDVKVAVFEAGADDYMTKPYATKELTARLKALLRRHEEPIIVIDPAFTIRDLYIYPDRHEVRIGADYIDLTKKEFDLLLYLAKNKNRVLTREQILEEVWGYGYVGNTNIVDVYVRYLRSKIDEKFNKKYIHTVRGIGYVVRD